VAVEVLIPLEQLAQEVTVVLPEAEAEAEAEALLEGLVERAQLAVLLLLVSEVIYV
jgi:hypothetical protein